MLTLVKVSVFRGKKAQANKNGKMPLFLTYISGDALPSDALVIDGTIAEGAEIVAGKTQVVKVTKTGEREWEDTLRNSYSYTVVGQEEAALYFKSTLSESKEQGVLSVKARVKQVLEESKVGAGASVAE